MTYNKILVPYDSSKPSETALEHAIQIAKMSGISLAPCDISSAIRAVFP
jgi:nucleotide-binding universal stress UspA family protein